jgi:hypothetical protein
MHKPALVSALTSPPGSCAMQDATTYRFESELLISQQEKRMAIMAIRNTASLVAEAITQRIAKQIEQLGVSNTRGVK